MVSKPTLILLPGQLCDAALWDAQVQALADIAEIRVADLTLDDTVEAMAERVLADAPPRFAICGLSLGGYVAFEIVRRAPERVTHLGLMNTSARPDTVDRSAERARSVRAARIGTFKGVTAHFLPSILHPIHAADPAMADVVLAMTERVGRIAFEKQQNAAILRPDCRPLLPAIRCPTLVVGGQGGSGHAADAADRDRDGHPGCAAGNPRSVRPSGPDRAGRNRQPPDARLAGLGEHVPHIV